MIEPVTTDNPANLRYELEFDEGNSGYGKIFYLPFTNPIGSGLLYDMKIYPKTSRPADPSSEEPFSESSSVSAEEKTQIAQLAFKQQMLFIGGILLLISSLSFLIFKNSKKNEI